MFTSPSGYHSGASDRRWQARKKSSVPCVRSGALGIAACSSGVTQDSAGSARLSGISISFLGMSLPSVMASSQALRTSGESGATSLPSSFDSFFASSRFQLSETLKLKTLFALVT